jgi:acetyl-CoA carboxylase carboxyl transferase subunit alpha
MIRHFLDFERPIAELEGKIEELRRLSTTGELNIADEVGRLQSSADRLLRQTYSRLTPWQRFRSPGIPNGRIASTISAD